MFILYFYVCNTYLQGKKDNNNKKKQQEKEKSGIEVEQKIFSKKCNLEKENSFAKF